MSYFGDVFDCSDKRMDYDLEDNWKQDDLKSFSFKAKSNPKDGLSVAHGSDLVQSGEKWGVKHKTELDWHCKCNNVNVNVTATLKDVEVKLKQTPEGLNKNGQNCSVALESKCNPAAEEADVALHGKFGGLELGPVRSWSTLKLKRESKPDAEKKSHSASHKVSFTQNFVYNNDFHVGFRTDADAGEKKLTNCYGHLGWFNTGYGNWYFRSNCLNRIVALGVNHKCSDTKHATSEVQWDFGTSPRAGLFGKPLFWRAGMDFHLKDGTKLNSRFNFGDRLWWTNKFDFQVTPALKFTFSERADLKGVQTWKDFAYTHGIALEFKM